jgi:hypothetical protein
LFFAGHTFASHARPAASFFTRVRQSYSVKNSIFDKRRKDKEIKALLVLQTRMSDSAAGQNKHDFVLSQRQELADKQLYMSLAHCLF